MGGHRARPPAGGPGGRAENATTYAAGLVQGIVLVTFPAASGVLTSPSGYALSATAYGAMFVPQVLTAIVTSLLGADLARRFGTKRVYLAGLLAGLVAMALLAGSQIVNADRSLAYPLLLSATAFLGAGFGLTVPALNTFAAAFHPGAVDRAVLVLNALLGLGTALAPVFVAVFLGLGFWWGLPLLSAAALIALFLVSRRLSLTTAGERGPAPAPARARIPGRFWVYAGFAVAYGVCETMNGNWSQLTMTTHLHASATMAALALAAFWAMVTGGRVFFAVVQRVLPARWTYRGLPFVVAGAFLGVWLLPTGTPAVGVLAFALAGLGCSALLPLTISFAQEELIAVESSVAGGVIAFYQLGYGIAAFGVGPLRAAGLDLPVLFGASALAAVAMGVLAGVLTEKRGEPPALHPRPVGVPVTLRSSGRSRP